MSNDNVLELKDVTKNYGDFLLDHVSFTVPRGTVCGFIGQNGAGKTTTIQLILDAITRDSGEITMFGQKVISGQSHRLREDVGVVFDEMGFHEFLTPAQLDGIMKRIYKNWNSEKFFEIYKNVSLKVQAQAEKFGVDARATQNQYSHLTNQGDTANIWTDHPYTCIIPNRLQNI